MASKFGSWFRLLQRKYSVLTLLMIIGAIVLLVFIAISLFPKILFPNRNKFISLPVSIHAQEEANYLKQEKKYHFAGLNLVILWSILKDEYTPLEEINSRIEQLEYQFSQPVPEGDLFAALPGGNDYSGSLFGNNPFQAFPQASPTMLPSATAILVPTVTLPLPTATLANTATQAILWVPSDTPQPSAPTAIPTATPTAEPATATPTLEPATATVTVSLTTTPTLEPVTETATSTPMLNPPTATATFTPPVTCNILTPAEELKVSFNPANGSLEVPFDVQPVLTFNQSMDPATFWIYDIQNICLCKFSNNNTCPPPYWVPFTISFSSTVYLNDTVTIHPMFALELGTQYTIFAGPNLKPHPACSAYSTPFSTIQISRFVVVAPTATLTNTPTSTFTPPSP